MITGQNILWIELLFFIGAEMKRGKWCHKCLAGYWTASDTIQDFVLITVVRNDDLNYHTNSGSIQISLKKTLTSKLRGLENVVTS